MSQRRVEFRLVGVGHRGGQHFGGIVDCRGTDGDSSLTRSLATHLSMRGGYSDLGDRLELGPAATGEYLAPWSTTSSAVRRPMPDAPPVMTATLPSKFCAISLPRPRCGSLFAHESRVISRSMSIGAAAGPGGIVRSRYKPSVGQPDFVLR